MFLQKYRKSNHKQSCTPQRQFAITQKVTDFMKKINPIEIKQHQPQNMYINPRTYLIESTKKVIRPKRKQTKQNLGKQAPKQNEFHESSSKTKDLFIRNHIDLSSRDARRAAAKSFRQRIWKSSDITPFIKAQQRKLLHKRTGYYQSFYDLTDSDGKVHRYQDLAALKDEPNLFDTQLRRQFNEQHLKNNLSFRTNSSQKNPERLQITNIQFKQQLQENMMSSSRQVLNRQRRKQLRMLHYSSVIRQQKRPNTTGGYNRQKIDDNIIQPW